eukprot:CAMPEP_0197934470 /NCGR_PEP_ID=MMETSP1439-20131203/111861_1 /TAXON_ID=66791 /ORGANISM="Gonyaulax spinifera, Strain CCMP409" /LENGTH=43 /DNA_ID= /DNA_START= /DNA_END= /DNA_ORIENTATION=
MTQTTSVAPWMTWTLSSSAAQPVNLAEASLSSVAQGRQSLVMS